MYNCKKINKFPKYTIAYVDINVNAFYKKIQEVI